MSKSEKVERTGFWLASRDQLTLWSDWKTPAHHKDIKGHWIRLITVFPALIQILHIVRYCTFSARMPVIKIPVCNI